MIYITRGYNCNTFMLQFTPREKMSKNKHYNPPAEEAVGGGELF